MSWSPLSLARSIWHVSDCGSAPDLGRALRGNEGRLPPALKRERTARDRAGGRRRALSLFFISLSLSLSSLLAQNVYFKKDEEALLRKLLSKVKAQADTVRERKREGGEGRKERDRDFCCPTPQPSAPLSMHLTFLPSSPFPRSPTSTPPPARRRPSCPISRSV